MRKWFQKETKLEKESQFRRRPPFKFTCYVGDVQNRFEVTVAQVVILAAANDKSVVQGPGIMAHNWVFRWIQHCSIQASNMYMHAVYEKSAQKQDEINKALFGDYLHIHNCNFTKMCVCVCVYPIQTVPG